MYPICCIWSCVYCTYIPSLIQSCILHLIVYLLYLIVYLLHMYSLIYLTVYLPCMYPICCIWSYIYCTYTQPSIWSSVMHLIVHLIYLIVYLLYMYPICCIRSCVYCTCIQSLIQSCIVYLIVYLKYLIVYLLYMYSLMYLTVCLPYMDAIYCTWSYIFCTYIIEQVEFPVKLFDYFLWSKKSNINQFNRIFNRVSIVHAFNLLYMTIKVISKWLKFTIVILKFIVILNWQTNPKIWFFTWPWKWFWIVEKSQRVSKSL